MYSKKRAEWKEYLRNTNKKTDLRSALRINHAGVERRGWLMGSSLAGVLHSAPFAVVVAVVCLITALPVEWIGDLR